MEVELVICPVDGATFSNQFDGLGDGSECRSDLASSDLLSSAVVTRPDPSSKGCDHDVSFEGWHVSEERVNVEAGGIGLPLPPVSDATFGSRSHDPRVNSLPRKHDITRDERLVGRWNSIQEFSCGRGKVVLKKCLSETWLPILLAGLDGTCLDASSAMLFALPGMGRLCRGEERV